MFQTSFSLQPFPSHWSPTLQSWSLGASTIIARGVTLNILQMTCTRFALTCVLGAKVESYIQKILISQIHVVIVRQCFQTRDPQVGSLYRGLCLWKHIQHHGAACKKLFWSAPKPLICLRSSKIWQLNQLHHQWCHLVVFPNIYGQTLQLHVVSSFYLITKKVYLFFSRLKFTF